MLSCNNSREPDRKSTRLNSSHLRISYAVFCLTKRNVHVNRSPAAGTLTNSEYRPGKFVAAMRERASVENEQNVFTFLFFLNETASTEIAALPPRRVLPF